MTPMIRYFLLLATPLGLGLLVLTMLLAASSGMAVPGNYWETEGLRRKLALIERPGREIMIVAGSNAYFGINAGDFARATGYHAVNLAMQGALPFSFYASLVRNELTTGDIVILPLEYAYYGTVHPIIKDRVAFLEASVALSLQPSYILTKPWWEWPRFLRTLSLRRLWEGALERLRPAAQRHYRVGKFDAWGDNVSDYLTPESGAHLANAVREELSRGLTKFDRRASSVQSLVDFVGWARQRGVTVVAALPNTLDVPPFAGAELTELRHQIARFWGEMGVPLLTAGATIRQDNILDSPYHPTLEGARLRTEALRTEFCRIFASRCQDASGDKIR